MNPVRYGIQQCHNEIPPEVLEYVFIGRKDRSLQRHISAVNIDSMIMDKVVTPRVMVDCNLYGGAEENIPLADCPKMVIDPFQSIYTIPKSLTGGRTITRALSVSFGEGAIVGFSNLLPSHNNNMLDAASGVLNSNLSIPQVSTANCMLIGENQVLIKDNFAIPTNAYLRCWLENDKNFNHLQSTAYDAFAQLILLAVKAYCYTSTRIPIDKGAIHAGFELGSLKEVIDEYRDANEQYRTHLKTIWRRVAGLNDFNSHRRHLQRLIGGPW